MDRRYSQSRFYNGIKASSGSRERGEALVKRYVGQAREFNRAAQSYGGSTGGASSIGTNAGLNVLNERSAQIRDRSAIFKEQGSGALGARSSAWQARQLPEFSGG